MNLSTLVQIHTLQASNDKKEAERRTDAVFIGYYAENGPTYDPDGKYLCGTCKFRVGKNKCATVEGKISFTTGSCKQWTIGPASNLSDELKHKYSQKEALYTERPNVKGFGCSRCEYGKKTKPDKAGRALMCSSWEMHVMTTACCERNEGKDDVYPGGEIEGGGVGSGRHKWGRIHEQAKSMGEVAIKHGYSKGEDQHPHFLRMEHPTKGSLDIQHRRGDSWIHYPITKIDDSNGEGKDAKSLDKFLTTIKAGGPGSGRTPYGQKFPGEKGAKPAVRKETIAAPIYMKKFDEEKLQKEAAYAKERANWKNRLSTDNSRRWKGSNQKETSITPGSMVKTTSTVRAFNNNTLEFQNYKPGTTVFVKDVLPMIGNNPQMLLVQFPHQDEVHVPASEVRFHFDPMAGRTGADTSIIPQRMPGGTKQFDRTYGGKYSLVPSGGQRGRPPGTGWKQGQPNPEPHSMKGQFSLARGPRGNKIQDIMTFDLNMKNFGMGAAKASVFDANRRDGSGTTVIAWRDTSNRTGKVMEFNHDAQGHISTGTTATKFNNLGHMGSYLSKRYGISMRLPK